MGGWNEDLNVFQNIMLLIGSPFIYLSKKISRNQYSENAKKAREDVEKFKKKYGDRFK